MPLRITSWNVNGIRNPFNHQPWRNSRSLQNMFDLLDADIVVMQEIKIQKKDLDDSMVLIPGWDVYFTFPRRQKGYSGVAIYTRTSKCCPIRAEEGVSGVLCPPNSTISFRDLPRDQQIGGYPQSSQLSSDMNELTIDSEGRCMIVEFPAFILLGVYSPANRDETRTEFRLSFLELLNVRVRNLIAAGKRVVLTGDLNVTYNALDTANLTEMLRKECMTMDDWMHMPARMLFDRLIFQGPLQGGQGNDQDDPVLWDLCRYHHPERAGMFTHWETKKNMRPANQGSRIDYILCSDDIKSWFVTANIQEGLMGSDHCPVYAEVSDMITVDNTSQPLIDLMNPPEMFKTGLRLREWSRKDLLSLSARLMPQFDRRRNIREMFAGKAKVGPEAENSSLSEEASGPQISSVCPLDCMNNCSAINCPETHSSSSMRGREMAASSTQDSISPPSPTGRVFPTQAAIPANRIKPPALESRPGDNTIMRKRKSDDAAHPALDSKLGKRLARKSSTGKRDGQMSQGTLEKFFVRPAEVSSVQEAPNNYKNREQLDDQPVQAESEPSHDIRDPNVLDTGQGTRGGSDEFRSDFSTQAHVRESWSSLLGSNLVPRCKHNEPCISFTTKKPGMNLGRSFYICPRPLGPTGETELDSEWRCKTFIWCRDWPSSQSRHLTSD